MKKDLELLKIQLGGTDAWLRYYHLNKGELESLAMGIISDQQASKRLVKQVFVRFWQVRNELEIQMPLICYLQQQVHKAASRYRKFYHINLLYEQVRINGHMRHRELVMDHLGNLIERPKATILRKVMGKIRNLFSHQLCQK